MNQGRIIEEHKTRYTLASESGVYSAVVRGLFHRDDTPEGKIYPKVGDYVEFTIIGGSEAVIERLLPRSSEVMRAVPPKDSYSVSTTSEVIVANVDIIFIVVGLDRDFNLSRVERYALLAKQSKIDAVILLNKADVVLNPASYCEQVRARLPQLPVHALSAASGTDMEIIRSYLKDDTTAVLLGSSGAGKSTITNWLLNEERQLIGGLRKRDGSGKHTTTSRQLFTLPAGGYLIDTPGMRELGVLSNEQDEAETFLDIDALTDLCRYPNCDHAKTDGCAILAALESGELDREHYANYQKLQNEREQSNKKGSVKTGRLSKNMKRKINPDFSSRKKLKMSDKDVEAE